MKKRNPSTFNKGLNTDYHEYSTPNDVLTDALNARLNTWSGDEFILQSNPGNELATCLTDGHILLGSATYLGISYLVSYNPTTGAGEIGSYPSPSYWDKEVIYDSILTSVVTDIPLENGARYLIEAEGDGILTLIKTFADIDLPVYEGTVKPCCGNLSFHDWPSLDYEIDGEGFKYMASSTSPISFRVTKLTDLSVGSMEDNYKPFQNLLIVPNQSGGVYGPFNTPRFNFSLSNPVEVELQLSYDGSINVILTDNLNPPLIINSRFTLIEGMRYEVIDRTGSKDDNLYSIDSFDTDLNLIIKSNMIPELSYIGQFKGGKLSPGNYRYYYRYSTQDGNLTDIIEESGDVSVFHGTRVSDIRGGIETESTGKLVRFTIDNLDTSFTYVRVYYLYKSGIANSIQTLYSIDKKYSIPDSGVITIDHSGYEPVSALDIASLSLDQNPIARFRTMAQSHGRLYIANITERAYDRDSFKAFSESMRIGYNAVPMVTDGNDFKDNPTQLNLPYINDLVDETYGYRSDMNLYGKLGYKSAETYPFGVVYILNDGSLTEVMPLTGIDDRFTGQSYTNSPSYDSDGWDLTDDPNLNTHFGQNKQGIYRFPRYKDVIGDDLIPGTMYLDGVASILGVKFTPDASFLSDPNYVDIKSKAKGLFFVRGPRVNDCLIQGYCVPTYSFSVKDFGDFDDNFYGSSPTVGEVNWRNLRELFNITSSPSFQAYPEDGNGYWSNAGLLRKVVPLVRGFIESTNLISPTEEWGPRFFAMNAYLRDIYRYGLYSGDLDTAQSDYTSLNNGSGYIYSLYDVQGIAMEDFQSTPLSVTPTLYFTRSVSQVTDANLHGFDDGIPVLLKYVFGSSSATNGSFSSKIVKSRLGGTIVPNSIALDVIDTSFGPYIGLQLLDTNPPSQAVNNGPTNIYGGVQPAQDGTYLNDYKLGPVNGFQGLLPIAQLVNIYPQPDGPIYTTFLKDRYRPQDIGYWPITPRMDFELFEDMVTADDSIKAFRGDSFLAHSFKKVLYGGDSEGLIDPEKVNTYKVGQGLMMFHEHDHNPYLRHEMVLGASKESFYPYQTGSDHQSYFRDGKDNETQLSNRGYNDLSGSKLLTSPDFTLPFVANTFDTRVMVSNVHTANTFDNGYRSFTGFSFEDYPRHLGPITKINDVNGTLVMVQSQGVSILPVSERPIAAESGGGNLFIGSSYVLPPPDALYHISEEYGSTYQWSIVESSNYLYGIDTDKSKIWRFTGKQLELISDFKIASLIKEPISNLRGLQPLIGTHDVRGMFDHRKSEVIWSLYGYPDKAEELDYIVKPTSLSITYSEPMGMWVTRNSWIAYNGLSIGPRFYSLDSVGCKSGLWLHDSLIHYSYYDRAYTFEYECTLSAQPYDHKVFTNLLSACNVHVPTSIIYSTDGQEVNQTLIYKADGNILRYNAAYKENNLYVVVPKEASKSHVRDKYIRLRFIYTGGNPSIIHSVITEYLNSFN